ncbi:eukaryotic translation initiation factor 2c [Aspergillus heteromorphus CBS 117.55]|uniref:Eukaryotic translation initiation factor 2c n=1 Tax=Aspergillus heteromorphus CBS 117.55 TaxID=1448321 RepID=A0A317X2T0_9EURO|nr:eukaryotic translation initiation factor 2c [Aspergillus heteromorphus CBS 117.55]PWY92461.1 eukaryotic translation initiation factor 2c [Aspergillus heteromorphus CBS 117.55]
MENIEQIHKLEGGLRHLRLRDADELVKYNIPVETVPRPGFNTTGKEVDMQLNAYPITKFPNRIIYQYDVLIGQGTEKAIVHKKVWDSKVRKKALKSIVYDGQKLAWSMISYPEFNQFVDLDIEAGREGGRVDKDGKVTNVFRLVVRPTRQVNLAVLNSWLQGRTSFEDPVLEALNFLDHVLREHPSSKFHAIKRSYFDLKADQADIGNGVLAFKGVYQAIRPALKRGLIVNVDVSNTCFWARTSLTGAAMAVTDARDHQHLVSLLRAKDDGYGGVTESDTFYEVHKRLRKLTVTPYYRGCPVMGTIFTVKGLINGNARQYKIDYKDKATGKVTKMSIEEYFRSRYNVHLNDWALPMVEMTKKGVVYPMEVLNIEGMQRYPWKLNEWQTSLMIKFAASRPAERLSSIMKSKALLDHAHDPVLQNFGLQIDNTMIKSKARLLPSPDIQFGGNQRISPGTAGRWDLRGKKFYQPNKRALELWGIGFFPGKRNAINLKQVQTFADTFMKTYTGHGGTVTQRPIILELKEDIGDAIKRLFNAAGAKHHTAPQLLLVIVPDKNSFTYTRIKKSCDCRWGVPSQVLQSAHVAKGNPQYHSNVLMKVNAKLGGCTSRVVTKTSGAALRPASMIIGADVTHPPMGVWSPSMAAMSVCMDSFGGAYWGACEANGDRQEIIARSNIEHMLTPLVREWMSTVNQGAVPTNVYYFRDGVSGGQHQAVLEQEVFDMKAIFMKLTKDQWKGKFTVVVANKRHHIRAFPKVGDRVSSDKNGNPVPGILIERDVTSPHDWDFLLYSHIALQGTARPVHYHVILDQIGHKPHELQNMIYDHCYQYMRSTTSVSLYPAIYYAHLISNRARSHEDVPASSGPQSGAIIKLTNPKPKNRPVDPTLLPIFGKNHNRLPFTMWFI